MFNYNSSPENDRYIRHLGAITSIFSHIFKSERLVDQTLLPELSRGDGMTLTSISTSKGFIL